jgi:hypothetical protein
LEEEEETKKREKRRSDSNQNSRGRILQRDEDSDEILQAGGCSWRNSRVGTISQPGKQMSAFHQIARPDLVTTKRRDGVPKPKKPGRQIAS